MPKTHGKRVEPIDYPTLTRELTAAARQAFTRLREQHPDETFYAYGLMTDGDAVNVAPAANSEQGLRRKAAENNQKRVPSWLRWGVDEWAYVEEGIEHFDKAQSIVGAYLAAGESDKAFAARKAAVHAAFADALKALDREGFFG